MIEFASLENILGMKICYTSERKQKGFFGSKRTKNEL